MAVFSPLVLIKIADSSLCIVVYFVASCEKKKAFAHVYLQTIYELNQLYSFKKLVIVVPSIAIQEGVLKNLQITHQHFQTLYNKTPVNYDVYDSKKVL